MSDDDYGYGSEYDYGSESEGDAEDDEAIEIANSYYEADDCKGSEPERALEMFERVVTLTVDKTEGEELKWRFLALENLVILHSRLGHGDAMVSSYTTMLEYISMVTRNACTESINRILDAISTGSSVQTLQRMYEITLNALKDANNERLWLNTNVKLGRVHLQARNFREVRRIAEEMKQACRREDGSDDMSKGSYLLEAYALEIQVCTLTHDTQRMKEIYPRTEALSAAVADPRIMGIIREEGGKMFMAGASWDEAYNEFYAAFRSYQEAGNPRAKVCLKYVVLSNMLALSDINPFAAREAKVLQDDKEIMAMVDLRMAYESNDMPRFERVLRNKSNRILEDEYLRGFIEQLRMRMRESVLLALVKPYQRLSMNFIAKELRMDAGEVEGILVSLILEQRLDGVIDQVSECLVLNKRKAKAKQASDALRLWNAALSEAAQQLGNRITV